MLLRFLNRNRMRGFALFLGLFLLVCMASLATGQDPMKGWVALSGKVDLEPAPSPEPVLKWQFSYGKDPSVLTRPADAAWNAASVITFQIKSDRDGRLFLRLDQKDKKIFLTYFDVTSSWRKVSLSPMNFQPSGSSEGIVDPALVAHAYLVDLNGSDGGERGARTVWIRDFSLQVRASEGSIEHRIPLVAYDAGGTVLGLRQISRIGSSGGRWCFLTGPEGWTVPMRMAEQKTTLDGKAFSVPTMIFEETRPVRLEVLFWPVGDEFNVWLQADGRGQGIQRGLRQGVFLLNLELAYTRYRKLQAYLASGGERYADDLRRIESDLKSAEQEPSLRQQAAAADRILLRLLQLSRDAVRNVSRGAVTSRLMPGPEIPVPVPKAGLLVEGRRVTIQLLDTEFRIGMAQGFGFATKPEPKEKIDAYYTELRRLGFNLYTMPLYWDQIVDKRGEYTRWGEILRFDKIFELGYFIHAHGFVQSGMPEDVRRLKGDKFLQAAKQHTSKVASDYYKRYGSSIVLWQAINEPSSNAFGGYAMEKRVKMVSDLIGHMRTVVPNATVVVNDYDWERGIEAETVFASKNITGSLRFYHELMRAENKPDVLSIEWYPGARVNRPQFKVDIAEPCMDLLDSSLYWDRFIALGRPLIFTESNFPGGMKKGDKNGYAWGRWDSQSQAQAAVDTFYLALSKKEILGWVWWGITDDEPWNENGGLFTGKGERKPVLERLAAEIASLKTQRELRVESSGKLRIPLLPGAYRITVDGGLSWTVVRDRSGTVSLENGRATGTRR